MPELQFDHPVPQLTEQEDAATLSAIEAGIRDADEGRTFSIDEVRRHMEQWLSSLSSRKSL